MTTVITHPISKWFQNEVKYITDHVAVEEPLEIRLEYVEGGKPRQKSISITMRTPGNDVDLALGVLFTEGIISCIEHVEKWKCCGPFNPSLGIQNVIKIKLVEYLSIDLKRLERHMVTSSSCGVCGKTSLEAIEVKGCRAVPSGSLTISAQLIQELPDRARISQQTFEKTGGIHATALFSAGGELLCIEEDVGRHNAMDKMIGYQLQRRRLPLSDTIVLVSGRASFELIQKAVVAGVPIFIAIGAPSSLAVSLAKKFNITLIGFANQNRFNLYCGEERVRAYTY